MNIFKRPYKVRRYGKTSWEDGVASAGYEDVRLMLDVQAKTRRNQDDPAGRTTTGTLTVYSDMVLHGKVVRLQVVGLLGKHHPVTLDFGV